MSWTKYPRWTRLELPWRLYSTRLLFLVAWNNQSFCCLKLRSLWGFMKGLRSYPSCREWNRMWLGNLIFHQEFMGNPWPGESEKVDLRWLCKAWKFGGFSRSNRNSVEKICVTFTLGDEFNRMKHDDDTKHIETHWTTFFFGDIKMIVFWCFPGASKACQQHLLVLPVVQVRFLISSILVFLDVMTGKGTMTAPYSKELRLLLHVQTWRKMSFGFKHLQFVWLQWKSTRIKVLRTAEAGNSTAVCNSIEIFGSGVSEPECFETFPSSIAWSFHLENYSHQRFWENCHGFLDMSQAKWILKTRLFHLRVDEPTVRADLELPGFFKSEVGRFTQLAQGGRRFQGGKFCSWLPWCFEVND